MNNYTMLHHYILTAFRNLRRNKFFTLINLVGLTSGMALFLLVQLWIGFEKSFDAFHKNKHRIYRIMVDMTTPDKPVTIWSSTPAPMGPLMQLKIPEIESVIRTTWPQQVIIEQNENKIVKNAIYVDSVFFRYFSFPVIKGNPNTLLDSRDGVVISESLARMLFGDEEPLNHMIRLNEPVTGKPRDVLVTGVFRDIPANSTMTFDMALPFETFLSYTPWNKEWGNYNHTSYAVLSPFSNVDRVNAKIRDFIKENRPDAQDVNPRLFLFPFTDIHLHDDFSKGRIAGGSILYVKLFNVISYFVLIIACINYINLATANAGRRNREVGLKKTIGASRISLTQQFLLESVILNLAATGVSVVLVHFFIPWFNQWFGKSVSDNLSLNYGLLVTGIFAFSSLLSGFYPSFILASANPAAVIKGDRSVPGSASLRNGLVVFQFVMSISMIIGILVVYRQVNYIRSKDLGFVRENVIHFAAGEAQNHQSAFRQELLKNPGIKSVSFCDQNPMYVGNSTSDPAWDHKPDKDNTFFHVISADHEFINTLGIQLLRGENIPEKTDSTFGYFLVNEQAVKAMNMKDPVGQNLKFWDVKEGRIVGVVKDFHHQSLHFGIEPLIIYDRPKNGWNTFVKITGDNIRETIQFIKAAYSNYEKLRPFEYSFLDADFDNMYKRESLMQELTLALTVIAVLISCLGLFGLSLFTMQRRRKEIAIRKVNGARTDQLVTLVSLEFVKRVLVAFIISGPLAWYFINRWLESFVFRVPVSWWTFAIAGLLALVIALGTVSYHAIKASRTNPVKALKYE